jgi:hypothetical protein
MWTSQNVQTTSLTDNYFEYVETINPEIINVGNIPSLWPFLTSYYLGTQLLLLLLLVYFILTYLDYILIKNKELCVGVCMYYIHLHTYVHTNTHVYTHIYK